MILTITYLSITKPKRYFASWKVYVQIMPISNANNLRFNLFDVTKVWSFKR
ncbi:MAG: catalase, partial [Gemmataceae bacterium]|nr:catalase [Gemmataceae bacterium]